MTPPAHFALVDESGKISFTDLQRIALSVDAQLKQDVYPVWQRHGDCTAYQTEADVPLGSWKVFIKNDLGQPGALGYHTDEHNQPVAYVMYQESLDDVCITVSHEVVETLLDPYGNRLILALHPTLNSRKVRILCEGCDPSEAKSYKKLSLSVSDFYFPEWFDDAHLIGQKYSFMDVLPGPRSLIQGGYVSYIDTDNRWYQVTYFSGTKPIVEGPFNWQLEDGMSLREMVDQYTTPRKSNP